MSSAVVKYPYGGIGFTKQFGIRGNDLMEKFGFKKHKKDSEDVIMSKWIRVDYSFCSKGWKVLPLINIVDYGNGFLLIDTKTIHKNKALDLLFDLIQAGLVEKWNNVTFIF